MSDNFDSMRDSDRTLLARLDERTKAIETTVADRTKSLDSKLDDRTTAIQTMIKELQKVFEVSSTSLSMEFKAHRAEVAMDIKTAKTDLGSDIKTVREEMEEIRDSIHRDFVTKDSFAPIQKIGYGLITAVGTAVVGGIMALIIHTK